MPCIVLDGNRMTYPITINSEYRLSKQAPFPLLFLRARHSHRKGASNILVYDISGAGEVLFETDKISSWHQL